MGTQNPNTKMKFSNFLLITLLLISCAFQKNLKNLETSQIEMESTTENQVEEHTEAEAENELERKRVIEEQIEEEDEEENELESEEVTEEDTKDEDETEVTVQSNHPPPPEILTKMFRGLVTKNAHVR